VTPPRVRVLAAFQSVHADIYSRLTHLGQHKAALVSGPSDRTVRPPPGNVPSKVVAVRYPLGHSPGLSSLKLSK
jgi:hypothetical protein